MCIVPVVCSTAAGWLAGWLAGRLRMTRFVRMRRSCSGGLVFLNTPARGALQAELAESLEQRRQLEAQLAGLQEQAAAAAAAAVMQGSSGHTTEPAATSSPALPGTPTAINNPAFSPDKQAAELHQQVGTHLLLPCCSRCS